MKESELTEQIIGGAIEVHSSRAEAGNQAGGSMRIPLLFLPLHTVRADLRLAIRAVESRANQRAYRQSRICANLFSVAQCLRGESLFRMGMLLEQD